MFSIILIIKLYKNVKLKPFHGSNSVHFIVTYLLRQDVKKHLIFAKNKLQQTNSIDSWGKCINFFLNMFKKLEINY